MTDLDKMARELFAAECPECAGEGGFEFGDGDWRNCGRCDDVHTVPRSQAESAIRAALLTAPPGYVLVPVEPTDVQLMWMGGHDEASQRRAYAGLIAAPEVK